MQGTIPINPVALTAQAAAAHVTPDAAGIKSSTLKNSTVMPSLGLSVVASKPMFRHLSDLASSSFQKVSGDFAATVFHQIRKPLFIAAGIALPATAFASDIPTLVMTYGPVVAPVAAMIMGGLWYARRNGGDHGLTPEIREVIRKVSLIPVESASTRLAILREFFDVRIETLNAHQVVALANAYSKGITRREQNWINTGDVLLWKMAEKKKNLSFDDCTLLARHAHDNYCKRDIMEIAKGIIDVSEADAKMASLIDLVKEEKDDDTKNRVIWGKFSQFLKLRDPELRKILLIQIIEDLLPRLQDVRYRHLYVQILTLEFVNSNFDAERKNVQEILFKVIDAAIIPDAELESLIDDMARSCEPKRNGKGPHYQYEDAIRKINEMRERHLIVQKKWESDLSREPLAGGAKSQEYAARREMGKVSSREK